MFYRGLPWKMCGVLDCPVFLIWNTVFPAKRILFIFEAFSRHPLFLNKIHLVRWDLICLHNPSFHCCLDWFTINCYFFPILDLSYCIFLNNSKESVSYGGIIWLAKKSMESTTSYLVFLNKSSSLFLRKDYRVVLWIKLYSFVSLKVGYL